jgi:hypothetical protein
MIATCRRQTLYILAAEEHIQSLEDNKMSSKSMGRVLLPPVRCVTVAASGGPTRSISGDWKAPRDESVMRDPVDQSDLGCGANCVAANATPVSHRATTLDVEHNRAAGESVSWHSLL